MTIVIIGVMAALASPLFINMMRDRRVNQAALAVSEMYRLARSRALGRGAAVLVRWTAGSNGEGTFEMREAVLVDQNTPMLAITCRETNWNTDTESRRVALFEGKKGQFGLAGFGFFDAAGGGPVGAADICFSPRGRTFFRDAVDEDFVVLAGVPTVVVTNTKTGLQRTVQIPGNGNARLTL